MKRYLLYSEGGGEPRTDSDERAELQAFDEMNAIIRRDIAARLRQSGVATRNDIEINNTNRSTVQASATNNATTTTTTQSNEPTTSSPASSDPTSASTSIDHTQNCQQHASQVAN